MTEFPCTRSYFRAINMQQWLPNTEFVAWLQSTWKTVWKCLQSLSILGELSWSTEEQRNVRSWTGIKEVIISTGEQEFVSSKEIFQDYTSVVTMWSERDGQTKHLMKEQSFYLLSRYKCWEIALVSDHIQLSCKKTQNGFFPQEVLLFCVE